MNLLSTIDKPTQGSIILDGQELTAIRNEKLAKLRKEHIGFIFQDYNLLDNMTLMDNIALPLSLSNEKAKNIQQRVQEMAGLFHLEGHLEKYPHQLSGRSKAAWSRCTCTDSQSPASCLRMNRRVHWIPKAAVSFYAA